MKKEEIIKDLIENLDFFTMMVSLYHKFSCNDLKQYKDILKWGGKYEAISKIGIDANDERCDIFYSLGLTFNQRIKWSSRKFKIYSQSQDFEHSVFCNGLAAESFDLLPFTLYDTIEADFCYTGNEINAARSKEIPYEEIIEIEKKIDAEFIDGKIKKYYPTVNPASSISEILKQFEDQKLTFDYGLLVNPQIWYNYYRKYLTKENIRFLLDRIATFTLVNKIPNPDEPKYEEVDEADLEEDIM